MQTAKRSFFTILVILLAVILFMAASFLIKIFFLPPTIKSESGFLAQRTDDSIKPPRLGKVYIEKRTSIGHETDSDFRANKFALHMSGVFWSYLPGRYGIGVEADDDVHLFVDGERIINLFNRAGIARRERKLWLSPGPHLMEIKFYQDSGAAAFRLFYRASGNEWSLIPLSRLTPLVKPLSQAQALSWAGRSKTASTPVAIGIILAALVFIVRIWGISLAGAFDKAGRPRGFCRLNPLPKKSVFLLVAVVLVASALFHTMALIKHKSQTLFPDAQEYILLAQRVPWSQPFTITFSEDLTVREPLTVWWTKAVISVGQLLGVSDNLAVRTGTMLQSLAAVLLTFLLARLWLGDYFAAWAAMWVGWNEYFLYNAVSGGRDSLFALCLLAFCYCAFVPMRKLWFRPLLLGLVAGLLCLTRMNGLLIALVVGSLALISERGEKAWAGIVVFLGVLTVLVSPHLWEAWSKKGDPLYVLNYHTWFFAQLDPRLKAGTTFWHYYIKVLGPLEFIRNSIVGSFDTIIGTTDMDSFFCRRSLPSLLFALPYGFYLLGLCLAVWRWFWLPMLILLILVVPFSPLLYIGADPRLVTAVIPFMALLIGLGLQEMLKCANTLGNRSDS